MGQAGTALGSGFDSRPGAVMNFVLTVKKIKYLYFYVLFFLVVLGNPDTNAGNEKIKIIVADNPLLVEIADSRAERISGLQFRDNLPQEEGMLFVYDRNLVLTFWMKNTSIPLDLAYLDENGQIKDIFELDPFDETIIASKEPVRYALEVNRGWFKKHGVSIGDNIDALPVL